jgi:hypothetical protein
MIKASNFFLNASCVGCTPWSALIGARTQQIDHILSARLKERFECVDLAARFYAELAKLTPTQRWLLVTRASVPPRAATSSRRRFRTTNRERAEGSAILSMNGLGPGRLPTYAVTRRCRPSFFTLPNQNRARFRRGNGVLLRGTAQRRVRTSPVDGTAP